MLTVGWREIDAETESELLTGLGHICHHVTLPAAPGDAFHAVISSGGLPPAESANVLGYKDEVFGPHRLGGAHPLIGVQLGRVDRAKRGGEVVVLLILPRVWGEMEEHPHLGILPLKLGRRRFGEAGLQSKGKEQRSDDHEIDSTLPDATSTNDDVGDESMIGF